MDYPKMKRKYRKNKRTNKIKTVSDVQKDEKHHNSTIKNDLQPKLSTSYAYLLKKLESNLSPKYIELNTSCNSNNRSRYGRIQKYKDVQDFLPTDIICSYHHQKHSTSKSKPVSKINYESPIDKLIKKNRVLALIETPSTSKNRFKKKKKLNKKMLSNEFTTQEKSTNGENKLKHNSKLLTEIPKEEDNVESDLINASSKEKETKLNFNVGDIYWGKIGACPYWPCIICPDEKGVIISDIGRFKRIHIRFLADNGRKSWLSLKALMEYHGLDDFNNKIKLLPRDKNSKKNKMYKSFIIQPNYKEKWDMAIKEAESILYIPIEHRLNAFDKLLLENRQKVTNEIKPKIRKKRSRHQSSKEENNLKNIDISIFPLDKKIKIEELEENIPFMHIDSYINELNSTIENIANVNKFEIKELTDRIENEKKLSIIVNIDNLTILSKMNEFQTTNNNNNNNNNHQNHHHQSSIGNYEFLEFFEQFKLNHFTDCINDETTEQIKNYLEKIWMLKTILNIKSEDDENKRKSLRIKTASLVRTPTPTTLLPIENIKQEYDDDDDDDDCKIIEKVNEEIIDTDMEQQSSTSTVKSIMSDFGKTYLFKKLSREYVCRLCYKPNNLFKCTGKCNGWYHRLCCNKNINNLKNIKSIITMDLTHNTPTTSKHITGDKNGIGDEIIVIDDNNDDTDLKNKCNDCKINRIPKCFVCGSYSDIPFKRIRCKISICGHYYHIKCLKLFPQTIIIDELTKLICPRHSCHTCISDDPRDRYLKNEKIVYCKCILCPSTYHMDSTCIPAGTIFLTAIQIICPKHRNDDYNNKNEQKILRIKNNINANWCFICTMGGNLVCCETCPTAFHTECLKFQLPEGNYICEECETGRLPLYGDCIWAKLGNYRWWPAVIIPPPAIPKNLLKLKKCNFDFCIKFFGTNNFSWIGRGRVFLYQEGDWGPVSSQKTGLDQNFQKALVDAKIMYDILKEEKLQRNIGRKETLKPKPYKKIRSNYIIPSIIKSQTQSSSQDNDIDDTIACDCNPNDVDPCGSQSKCLNRMLMYECDPNICLAKKNCLNQRFQQRIYPNLKIVRTDTTGFGLFTLENLHQGQFIIEYIGELIDMNEFKRRVEKKRTDKVENYYFLTINNNLMIDAEKKGNEARFMNHSCEPNCETQKWQVGSHTRIGLFAVEDIPANTELTFNYLLDCMGGERKICHCGAKKCSGFIGAKFKENNVKLTSSSIKKEVKKRRINKKKIKPKIIE